MFATTIMSIGDKLTQNEAKTVGFPVEGSGKEKAGS
jgi:hypothetical protein